MFSATKPDSVWMRLLRSSLTNLYRSIMLMTLVAALLMAMMMFILFTTITEPLTGMSVAALVNLLLGTEITHDMVVQFTSVMSIAFLMNSIIGFILMMLVMFIRKKFDL